MLSKHFGSQFTGPGAGWSYNAGMHNTTKGQRLRIARLAAGFNQRQLAGQLQVDQALISRVEKGSYDGTVEFWCGVARLLGVSLDYLLIDAPMPPDASVGEPRRMNRMAILADYTLARGLRQLATDQALVEVLAIDEDEWTQLAAVPLPAHITKDGFLQLLITLRTLRQSAGADLEDL